MFQLLIASVIQILIQNFFERFQDFLLFLHAKIMI